MFCPECKYEYCDGIEVCPDCGAALVEDLSAETEKKEFNPDEEICKVYTAVDEFEAEVVIAKLRAEGIYAMKSFKSTDSYSRIILGRTILGVEIFVAESDLETAMEIIKS